MTSSALRYYERCGLIMVGTKIGGRRHYPSSVLHRLSVIKVCQKIGFSLTEIAELLNGNLAREGAWRHMALTKRDEVRRQISQLEGLVELLDCALQCDCNALCECPQMGPGGHLAAESVEDAQHSACRAVDRWHQRTTPARAGDAEPDLEAPDVQRRELPVSVSVVRRPGNVA